MRLAHLVRLSLIFLVVTNSAYGITCKSALKKLGWVAASPLIAAAHVSASVFYPFWAVPKGALRARKQWKEKKSKVWVVPIQELREDKWHALGYAAMIIVANGTSISFPEFDDETKEFDDDPLDGQVVIVNFAKDSDPAKRVLGEVARQRHRQRDQSKVHYIEVGSVEELSDRLQEIAETHGPIAKIDTYGHGYPGYVEVGNSSGFRASQEPRAKLPRGVTLPGAKVRIHACLTANGEKGEEVLDHIGSALLPDGGTIYSSKVLMGADPAMGWAARFGSGVPPEPVRNALDPLMRPVYGVGGAVFNYREDKIEEKFPIGHRTKKHVVGKRQDD